MQRAGGSNGYPASVLEGSSQMHYSRYDKQPASDCQLINTTTTTNGTTFNAVDADPFQAVLGRVLGTMHMRYIHMTVQYLKIGDSTVRNVQATCTNSRSSVSTSKHPRAPNSRTDCRSHGSRRTRGDDPSAAHTTRHQQPTSQP